MARVHAQAPMHAVMHPCLCVPTCLCVFTCLFPCLCVPVCASVSMPVCASLPAPPQGVGSLFAELGGLCGGTRLPGVELVEACGNSFGRGPLICHFPHDAMQALRER